MNTSDDKLKYLFWHDEVEYICKTPPLIFRFWEIVSSNWKHSKIRWGRKEKKGREAGMRQVWYLLIKTCCQAYHQEMVIYAGG